MYEFNYKAWHWEYATGHSVWDVIFIDIIKRYIYEIYQVYLLVCLQLHVSQGYFCPRTYFENTE